jgi:hypothetical protein
MMLNAETPDLGNETEGEVLKYLQEMPGRSARRRWSQLIPNRVKVVGPRSGSRKGRCRSLETINICGTELGEEPYISHSPLADWCV